VGGSGLPPVEPGPIADQTVVRELVRRLAEVDERVRARMDRLGEMDLASQDVLIDVVRALEQQLWMIRVQLEGGA
jgi:starvation-inducible DNA-binding protein